jgi:hypothetical protein
MQDRGARLGLIGRAKCPNKKRGGYSFEAKGRCGVRATYIGFLVQKRHDFGSWHRSPGPRRRGAVPAMVRSVGVVAVAVRPIVAVRMRAVLLRGGGVREADLGRVSSRKLLAKKALQLPHSPSCTACSGALAAGRRSDARDGGTSLVGEVGSVGRVGAARGRGAADRGPHAGGELRAKG